VVYQLSVVVEVTVGTLQVRDRHQILVGTVEEVHMIFQPLLRAMEDLLEVTQQVVELHLTEMVEVVVLEV
jgi:hypothetical protein